jgi:hypothetical protein
MHLVQGFVHGWRCGLGISPTAPGGGGACARHHTACSGRNEARTTAPPNAKSVLIETPQVRAFARYVLLMPGMDQTHGEASIGQHLKHGNPQHPGGFQGHGVDSARLPPVRQGPDAVGERRKAADRLGIPIRLPTTPYRYRSPPPAAAVPATWSGSRRALGLLGPAMPRGSRFARYSDACLVGALLRMPRRPGCFRPAVCYTRGSSQAHPDDAP